MIDAVVFRRESSGFVTLLSLFLFFLLALGYSASALSEPPADLDFIGGYYDKGEYKCFSEPCFTIHRGTEAAAERNRPFDHRDWVPRTRSCQKAFTKVLADTSVVPISYAKKGDCAFVVKGEWLNPYNGERITKMRDIALDQRVSYKEVHRYGGAYWSRVQRMALVNDPLNLVPVSRAQKKARDGKPPSQWMPEEKRYWCDYIVHREIIQRKYSLFLPRNEREEQERIKTLYCKY
jgi:hypothetical protein